VEIAANGARHAARGMEMNMSTETVLKALQTDVQGHAVGEFLASHLHKPQKAPLFQAALAKFMINGHFRFAATWSWWAFFGGAFYFFYRKMYLYGLIALGSDIIAALTGPLTPVIVAVCCGISAKFLYCKKFIDDLDAAGYPNEPAETVNRTLALLGGYNVWAVVVFFVVKLLIIAVLIFTGAILLSALVGR
jgi:hypothetical protein